LEPPEDVVVLGRIHWVRYGSRKDFEGDEDFLFEHEFELDHKPYLAKGEGRHFVLGGGYTVIAHGIVDDPDDRRDVPKGKDVFEVDLSTPSTLTGMGRMHSFDYENADGDVVSVRVRGSLAYNTYGRTKTLYVVPSESRTGQRAISPSRFGR